MSSISILSCGPGLSVQDQGRPGYLEQGLSVSGAADSLALLEGSALLGQAMPRASIEMAGMGGKFQAQTDLRIALTGAVMQSTIDGVRIAWNTSHFLTKDALLSIGGAQRGIYGYLSFGGGISTSPFLGSRSAHLRAGLNRSLQSGDILPTGEDTQRETGLGLEPSDRLGGGFIRTIPSLQSALFSPEQHQRFVETIFTRSPRGNRMGVALKFEGQGFAANGQLSILSEIIVPGDVQMTGDGRPFVLLPECQTTGGYPRIATVIPADMPKLVQAPPGAQLQFKAIGLQEALNVQTQYEQELLRLPAKALPRVRDPHEMADLLSYQLISGAISATADSKEN
jgi:biotin-dependent carboxylase-like uncharacterized protein